MTNELNTLSNRPVEPAERWSDEQAAWYVENYGEHPNCELAVQAADLKGHEAVLDIGCGSGAAVRAAAGRLTDGSVIGIDPTPAMVRFARERSRSHVTQASLRFAEAPAECLPVDDASIDVAIAICSLHHWSDIAKGLSEIVRVLKPNGRLIVVEDIFDEPERGMDDAEIRLALQTAGLDVVVSAEHIQGEICANLFVARPGNV